MKVKPKRINMNLNKNKHLNKSAVPLTISNTTTARTQLCVISVVRHTETWAGAKF